MTMKQLNRTHLGRRFFLLFIGLLAMALGVAVAVKSNLGVSPISSVPYVVSLITDFTIGELTIIMHFILMAFQLVLLRRRFPKVQLLQLPVGIAFGYMIDLFMFLLSGYAAQTYAERCGLCVFSLILLGFGVFCEVKADVAMLPGEGFVSALTTVTGIHFSRNKVIVDASLVAISVLISFVYCASLQGVREGTIAAAIAVGIIAGIFLRKVTILDRHLVPEPVEVRTL